VGFDVLATFELVVMSAASPFTTRQLRARDRRRNKRDTGEGGNEHSPHP
jgi:hypothetical protein